MWLKQEYAEEFRQLAYSIGTSEESMLDMFLDGVNAETRKLLSIVHPTTFEDAMEAAAKINGEEKVAYSINSVQKSKIQCRACKKTEHMERDCWTKNGKQVDGNKLVIKDKLREKY